MHFGVAVNDIFHLAAFAARALNANAVHRAFEGVVFHQHVIDAAGAFAADRDTAPLLQRIVGDVNILDHPFGEARIGFLRFDGDMIVIAVDIIVGDADVLAVDRIDGVGIRRMPRG